MKPEERLRELSGKATAPKWRRSMSLRDHTIHDASDNDIARTWTDADAALISLSRNLVDPLVEVAAAARAYLDYRDARLAAWNALATCGHDEKTNCPEWEAVHSEPFDRDVEVDTVIRQALQALDAAAEAAE